MSEKKTFYDIPTQVRFRERDNDSPLYGIAVGDTVICACCGAVFSLTDEDYEIATVEKELSWVNFTDAISGEWEEEE